VARNMKFPEKEAISELIEMLVGRGVRCSKGEALSPTSRDLSAQAVYIFDDGEVAAVALCDLGFSGAAGAALSMLNAEIAEQCVASRELDDIVRENLYEVLNIGASWFNAPFAPHVKLRELHVVPTPIPEDAEDVLFDYHRRSDLKVEIEGYPVGTLTLLEAA
jgi:hypothetical protein